MPAPAPKVDDSHFTFERPAGQQPFGPDNKHQNFNLVTEQHNLKLGGVSAPPAHSAPPAFKLSTAAAAFVPSFAQPAKPAPKPQPPKKEPIILKLEEIAKPSEDEKAEKGKALIDIFNLIKKDGLKTELLRKFVTQVAPIDKENEAKHPINVSKVVLTRPEPIEKPLPK